MIAPVYHSHLLLSEPEITPMGTVTTPGYYDGEFKQAGQSHSGEDADAHDLDKLSKDELAALAKERGIEVKTNDTKADIIAKLSA